MTEVRAVPPKTVHEVMRKAFEEKMRIYGYERSAVPHVWAQMENMWWNGIEAACHAARQVGIATVTEATHMQFSHDLSEIIVDAAARAEPLKGRAETVESASDARVINNVMRHEYRVLSDEEKWQMKALKDKGLEFVTLLHSIGGTSPTNDRQATRELSLAQTAIEEAVMWAVKHITR